MNISPNQFRDTDRPAAADLGGRCTWPLERVLFALAGTMSLLSIALALAVSPWFLLLTALVAINQWLYVIVGACPASIVLRRACHLRSAIYADHGSEPERRTGLMA